MKFKVTPTDKFKKEAKRLSRKYPSLNTDLAELGSILERTPSIGTALGRNIFKVRLAIKSKGKGKSGGARVITYLVTEEFEVYLLTIYDKSELETVDNRLLRRIVEGISFEN